MSWFYLALLAPLLYAVVNLFDDNLLHFVYKSTHIAAISAGFYGSLPLLSLLFIRTHNIALNLALLSVASGFLTLTYFYFYFKGLEVEQPSVVVALFGLAPAIIPFFAHFIVHEQLMLLQAIGFIIVVLSSFALAVTDVRKFKFSKALVPVLIAVGLMVAISLATKYVYEKADFYPAYMYFSLGMGLGGICFFLLKYQQNRKDIAAIFKNIKKLLPIFIAAELTGLGAEFTLNLAISRGPVSLVKGIESIQPIFVLLIALALYPFRPKYFREAEAGNFKWKLLLMATSVVGLIIIGVGTKV